VSSSRKIQRVDITGEISKAVAAMGVRSGCVLVSVPHTTAAVAVGENWDEDVGSDLERAMSTWVPDVPFRHSEGNSPAHFLSEVFGNARTLPVEDGKVRLGRWQGVFLWEFDGPRDREVWVDAVDMLEEKQ
jgi:secondary thiamine-phosphate synthase enzyme